MLEVVHAQEAVDHVIPFGIRRFGYEVNDVECAVDFDQGLIAKLTVSSEDPVGKGSLVFSLVDLAVVNYGHLACKDIVVIKVLNFVAAVCIINTIVDLL